MSAQWEAAKLPAWRSAMEQVEAHLLEQPRLERLLLRLERGPRHGTDTDHDTDRGHAAALTVELAHQQQKDGSWNGDVFATCDALRTMRDLRAGRELHPAGTVVDAAAANAGAGGAAAAEAAAAAAAAAARRAGEWLLARIGEPGRFGETCDAELHEAGLCHHVMPPFCSAGHAGTNLRGARLPDGTVFETDAEARLCGAALALRELLAAGANGTGVRLQVSALEQLSARGESGLVPRLGAAAFAAIADALRMREHSPPAATLRAVAMRQRGDGTWGGGDSFILDVLSRACAAGIAEAREPLRRAADHLALSYGTRTLTSEPQRRLLVAWRVLRCATA